MYYTVRYAHLKDKSILPVGTTVLSGDFLGVAGNTGSSGGRHLHIDCVEGYQNHIWHLADMENGILKPSPKQLNWFIDQMLFMHHFAVTTPYCDYDYMSKYGKVHHAYDLVPWDYKKNSYPEKESAWRLHWNRSNKKKGNVLYNGHDDAYGNCLLIGFEA